MLFHNNFRIYQLAYSITNYGEAADIILYFLAKVLSLLKQGLN